MRVDVVERDDGISHVALSGRLDVTGTLEVDLKLKASTVAAGRPTLVDLSAVEYIASRGIGLLMECAQELGTRGHRMVLVGATGDVDAALRRAGLDTQITMAADIASGEQALGAR